MFAFQLPFGSLIEARHAILPAALLPLPVAAEHAAEHASADGIVHDAVPTSAPAAFDVMARVESVASALDAQLARGDSTVDERLLAVLAATLREFDCGVVVCAPGERAPSFLVLGRRPATAQAVAGTTVTVDDASATRPCDRTGAGESSLLTLLFTDIVASTEIAERLGDDAWRSLLDRHRRIVREHLAAFRGVEIDNAGDGFFATFDTPARAVRCAEAIEVALAAIGVSIRAGIHAGECAAVAGRISGVAVHVAARIVEVAQPGEVLVSGTVRDLVAGSGLEFCDRDWHALKGLSGSRQLFALRSHAPR